MSLVNPHLASLLRNPRRLLSTARDPRRAARGLNRAYHRRLFERTCNPGGVDVVAADWDNLVVLDACRYDVFAERHALPGRLTRRTSRGSHTAEFLSANFGDADLSDLVYVTANVLPYRYRETLDDSLFRMVSVWTDGFDEDAGTVLPETTTERALDAAARHPNKRLVVHYLQPHYPFVGVDTPFDESEVAAFWDAVAAGEYDRETVREWYAGNLDRALPHVADLVDALDGRTVVTADHGTALGERSFPVPVREWGHPWGTYIEPLVAVPWLVVDDGRRRTESDDPVGWDEVDEAVVQRRLERLGYA